METKYILTPKNHKSISIVFKFDLNGLLSYFEISGEYDAKQHDYVISKMPLNESGVDKYPKDMFIIEKVPLDLSFEAFWNAYGNKVGKKIMAENTWNKLSEGDKINALLYIKKYDHILISNGTQKAYPSTYLNQRYFDA